MSHTQSKNRVWRSCAAGVGALSLFLTPVVAVADNATSASPAIIFPDRSADGEVMNYAVVLAEGSSAADLNALVEYVKTNENVALAQYPHLSLFFAQSAKKNFASSLAAFANDKGITLHSVGPTRGTPVKGAEVVVKLPAAPQPEANTGSAAGGNDQSSDAAGSNSAAANTDANTNASANTDAANNAASNSEASNSEATNSEAANSGSGEGGSADGQGEASGAGNAAGGEGQGGNAHGGTQSLHLLDIIADFVPDPRTEEAWGLKAIGALEAAEVDVPLAEVVVGVIDTGIDPTHPDLEGQVLADKSVSCSHNGIPNTDVAAWTDNHYHGTHVAGTIAAAHNGVGVDSVAPKAKLAAVQAGNADGLFYPEYVTCAFDWAAKQEFDITNNSYYVDPWAYWMPNEPSQAAGYEAVRRAVAYADYSGVLNIAAAGNKHTDLDTVTKDSSSPNDNEPAIIQDRDVVGGFDIPTELPGVVTVSAVAHKPENAETPYAVADFSNYGAQEVDLTAPGERILSTVPMRYRVQHANLNGTSMASPHVAGVAALLKGIHPSASNDRIVYLLKKQAGELKSKLLPSAEGKAYEGAGLVNALAAVLKDQPQPSLASPQYSVDNGETWHFVGDKLNVALVPNARLRLSAIGSTTELSLSIGDAEVAKVVAASPFGDDLTAVTEAVDFADLFAKAPEGKAVFTLGVAAKGRNNDPRADDDIATTFSFTLVNEPPAQEAPQSEAGAKTAPAADQKADKAAGKTVPTKKGPNALAASGATTAIVLFFTAMLLLAAAVLLTVKRHATVK